ncbi:MAG: DUF2961 domain-containing protein [Planctomycetes bacterium]|nr:DUF2961 domain-containing protein [Planctomycetota bacterium]
MSVIVLALTAASSFGAPPVPCQSVDRASLARELADRDAVLRLDAPAFRTRLWSSFDRRAVRRDANWFADDDRGHALRVLEREGRREWVLVDARGPGALVAGFATPLAGRVRLYFDGANAPALDLSANEFFRAAESSKCGRLTEPIPYARGCVLTVDVLDGLEYAFDAREYAPETAVATLAPAEFGAPLAESSATPVATDALVRRFEGLLSPANPGAPIAELELTLPAEFAPRGHVIREIELALDPLDVRGENKHGAGLARDDVLRRTVLVLEFDGARTVEVPVGDFFVAAAGDAERTRSSVTSDRLISRWPMPYRETARLALRQTGKERVAVRCKVTVEAFDVDERTLRFGAQWSALAAAPTLPLRDWRVLALEGRGKFVGETLSVGNPLRAAATRADVKLWIDGEGFPSYFVPSYDAFFGACTPDGAGFARRDADDGSGWTVFVRERTLDAVPFTLGLLVEHELACDAPTELEVAATTFYYLASDARAEAQAPDALASAGWPRFDVRDFALADAQEGETLGIATRADGVVVAVEPSDGRASGRAAAAIGGLTPGKFVEFDVTVAAPGAREVTLRVVPRATGGAFAFAVGGVPAARHLELAPTDAGTPRTLSLGVFELAPPSVRVRIEALGPPNGPATELGLDCVQLVVPGS